MPILSGIHTLGQHLEHLQSHAEEYLPDQCPLICAQISG
jgi:hypothetical protein